MPCLRGLVHRLCDKPIFVDFGSVLGHQAQHEDEAEAQREARRARLTAAWARALRLATGDRQLRCGETTQHRLGVLGVELPVDVRGVRRVDHGARAAGAQLAWSGREGSWTMGLRWRGTNILKAIHLPSGDQTGAEGACVTLVS